MAGKPMSILVLSPEGSALGRLVVRANNASWRILGQVPHVHVAGVGRTRELEKEGEGWALRLLAGEPLPRKMEPV